MKNREGAIEFLNHLGVTPEMRGEHGPTTNKEAADQVQIPPDVLSFGQLDGLLTAVQAPQQVADLVRQFGKLSENITLAWKLDEEGKQLALDALAAEFETRLAAVQAKPRRKAIHQEPADAGNASSEWPEGASVIANLLAGRSALPPEIKATVPAKHTKDLAQLTKERIADRRPVPDTPLVRLVREKIRQMQPAGEIRPRGRRRWDELNGAEKVAVMEGRLR